jgi:hypothetical protein
MWSTNGSQSGSQAVLELTSGLKVTKVGLTVVMLDPASAKAPVGPHLA